LLRHRRIRCRCAARDKRLAVNRLFFVGRNYHRARCRDGAAGRQGSGGPFISRSRHSTLVESGGTVPYPPQTNDYQHEMELVGGDRRARVPRCGEAGAHALIYGYACGLDMTRRDLQLAARDKGRPWDLGKDVEHSSVVSEIVADAGRSWFERRAGVERQRQGASEVGSVETHLEHSRADRPPIEVSITCDLETSFSRGPRKASARYCRATASRA